MKHFRNKSESKLGMASNRDFPVLKPVSFYSKPLVPLSKVQISRNIMDSHIQNQSKELRPIFSHKRVFSGVGRQTSYKNFTKSTTRFHAEPRKYKQSQKHQTESQYEIKKEVINNSQEIIERNRNIALNAAKISNQSFGGIKGYAVNSHKGLLNSVNEDRVCIVTNINKYLCKNKESSFFGVFDAKNGAQKAEFYRDNFHNYLIKQKQFYCNPQRALKNTFEHVQKICSERIAPNTSRTSLIIILIIQEMIYCLQTGESKCLVSQQYGHRIFDPFQKTDKALKKQKQFFKNPLKIRSAVLSVNNLDFIILGSEGLVENMTLVEIAKTTWKSILVQKKDNYHISLGLAVNSLITEALVGYMSTKNVSLIMLGFQNSLECFKKEKLELPNVDENKQACIN